jgi:hypothetical protein
MDYPTRNNRLLYYELYDPDPNDFGTPVLLRTVSYMYWMGQSGVLVHNKPAW